MTTETELTSKRQRVETSPDDARLAAALEAEGREAEAERRKDELPATLSKLNEFPSSVILAVEKQRARTIKGNIGSRYYISADASGLEMQRHRCLVERQCAIVSAISSGLPSEIDWDAAKDNLQALLEDLQRLPLSDDLQHFQEDDLDERPQRPCGDCRRERLHPLVPDAIFIQPEFDK